MDKKEKAVRKPLFEIELRREVADMVIEKRLTPTAAGTVYGISERTVYRYVAERRQELARER